MVVSACRLLCSTVPRLVRLLIYALFRLIKQYLLISYITRLFNPVKWSQFKKCVNQLLFDNKYFYMNFDKIKFKLGLTVRKPD